MTTEPISIEEVIRLNDNMLNNNNTYHDFITAAPRIAAKAIALNTMLTALNQNMDSVQQTNDVVLKRLVKVNKELVKALKYARERLSDSKNMHEATNLDNMGAINLIDAALTKAEAL